MFTKTLPTAVLALAASTLVAAQTSTDCNPLEKTCPDDPAFGATGADCDFTSGACSAFKELDGTDVTYNSNGAVFAINKETDAPTMETGKYIFFGRIDVDIQAAAGDGIVTSAVLESDDLDEIDWEWVGGDDKQAQSNYFSKGDDSTWTRGAYHAVDNPLTSFHTYSVEWTSQSVKWIIDGATVRTLTASSVGDAYPQTPMQVKIGTWCAGGKNSPEGTKEWAGGATDFSQAPFNAYYKSLTITDYAGGDSETSKNVQKYVYSDHTGDWESIKVVTDGSSDDDSSSTTTKKATSTEEATSTTSSMKPRSTKATTTKAESTTATTTMASSKTKASGTTMTTASSGSMTSKSGTSTSGSSSGTTTSAAPAQTTSPDSAAPRGTVAIGSILLAAGVLFAQLL